MNEILNQLLRLKTAGKAGVTAGLLLLMGGLYYYFFYMDVADQITAAVNTQQTMKTERASYEQRKREYLEYRDELRQLQEEQREILRALPKKAEIPSFLSSIQEQAELSGLEVLTLVIEPEAPQDLYIRIPVSMELRGTYHAIAKFFKNLSEIRRIVNVENLSLIPTPQPGDHEGSPKLRARFTAVTFRYADKKV